MSEVANTGIKKKILLFSIKNSISFSMRKQYLQLEMLFTNSSIESRLLAGLRCGADWSVMKWVIHTLAGAGSWDVCCAYRLFPNGLSCLHGLQILPFVL